MDIKYGDGALGGVAHKAVSGRKEKEDIIYCPREPCRFPVVTIAGVGLIGRLWPRKGLSVDHLDVSVNGCCRMLTPQAVLPPATHSGTLTFHNHNQTAQLAQDKYGSSIIINP